jgi:hypothetical protein
MMTTVSRPFKLKFFADAPANMQIVRLKHIAADLSFQGAGSSCTS